MNFDAFGRLARPIVLSALAAAAFSALGQEPIKTMPDTAANAEVPRGIHWKNDPQSLAVPGSVAARRAAAEAELRAGSVAARTSGKTLTYYGGPIVKNIKVIQVLYGSGTYQSFVQGTGSGTMSAFYGGVVGSPYFTWLNGDYGTGSGKTTQSIGYGSFAGQVTITPSSSRNGSTITDAQIRRNWLRRSAPATSPRPTPTPTTRCSSPRASRSARAARTRASPAASAPITARWPAAPRPGCTASIRTTARAPAATSAAAAARRSTT